MTQQLPILDFPPVRLRARRNGDRTEIWDAVRGMYLVLTPEEWVRQHLTAFLVSHCGVPPHRIVAEYPVPLNGQPQRADIVAVDDRGEPAILAECKAADVKLDQSVLAQAVRYNSVLRARYIILTNGLKHRCYEYSDGQYRPAGFPVMRPGAER
ncbi:MAG: type I restriction enzyme HsdR N-terminal domain-containing protein [Alistipes sp.]|nr:type I restriction enzyme HsdR N-terminal domain-containing protein [Alistipes sp.]